MMSHSLYIGHGGLIARLKSCRQITINSHYWATRLHGKFPGTYTSNCNSVLCNETAMTMSLYGGPIGKCAGKSGQINQ